MKMKNKKYHVTSFAIQRYRPVSQYQISQISGQNVNMSGTTEIEISLDILIPNDSDLKLGKGDTMEAFEAFLAGVPEWCTPEMLYTALQAKYPERYL